MPNYCAMSSTGVLNLKTTVRFILALGSALTLIPWPVWLEDRPQIFPLDVPAWSLFFELCANLVFVVYCRRLSNRKTLVAGFPRTGFSFFAGVLVQRYLPKGIRIIAPARSRSS
jgi:hypothetical protein